MMDCWSDPDSGKENSSGKENGESEVVAME